MDTITPQDLSGSLLPSFILREEVSSGAKLLYALLCKYCHDKDHCWPSHKLLAGELGCSVSSIKNWLHELVTNKLIAIRREEGRYTSTYYLLCPAALDGSTPSGPDGTSGMPLSGDSQTVATAGQSHRQTLATEISLRNKNKYSPLSPRERACGCSSSALTFPRPRPCRGGRGDSSLADSSFEQFSQRYPRKEAKELARAVWHRLWRRGLLPSLGTLLTALDRFKQSPSWNREHGRFIPHLVNWLRGQRWLDEPHQGSSLPPITECAADSVRSGRIRQRVDELERSWRRTEPELEAARPVFEAFLARFADGHIKRGPAWGLWSLLWRQGKAPDASTAPEGSMSVLDFLKTARYAC